jgi:HSP20 family protein
VIPVTLSMRDDRPGPVPFEPRRPEFGPWWDPFRQIDETLGRMGRLFEGAAGGRLRADWPWPAGWGGLLADVEETEDGYVIEVELPGVRAEDLDVEVRDDRLWIRGEVKDRERTGEVRHQSRYHGRFEHVLPLPPGTDPDRIDAALSDGVLTVRVPKAEPGGGRRIEVRQG